jgi:predicted transcriptional regulator
MEVHLSADKEAQLAQIAARRGSNANLLAEEILAEYLKHESRFADAIKVGEVDFDDGNYLSHEEVGTRVGRLIQS